MLTTTQAVERFGIRVEATLDFDDPIPVHSGLQFQGDIAIIPSKVEATGEVPVEGFPVVRGENGGNTHLLLKTPGVTFDSDVEGLLLGRLTVAKDATAYLAHPQHGYVGVGPGTYEIRRQREQADEIRMVQD